MKRWIAYIENPQWHRFGFPVDFESNKAFYFTPLFFPFLDYFLIESIGIKRPTYPDNSKFAVCLTFDLDTFGLKIEYFRRIHTALKRKEIKAVLAALKWAFLAPNRTDLDIYLDLLARQNLPATFFAASVNRDDPRDPMYKLWDRASFRGRKQPIAEILRSIVNAGHEIGLHPSIRTFQDADGLKKQKQYLETNLGSPVLSLRQHWLMFDPALTPGIQGKAGFRYDSTFGFNRMPGFRAGTAYPFRFGDDSPLEIPLIFQEGALLRGVPSGSMGLSLEKAIALTRIMLTRIARVGGVAVVLVHPTHYSSEESRLRQMWLRSLVEYAQELGAIFMTIRQVGEYWESNYESLWQQVLSEVTPEDVFEFWRQRQCAEFWAL